MFFSPASQLLATLSCEGGSSNSEEENSVEAVTFCPDTTFSLAVTGTLHGRVSFWDIVHQVERQSFEQPAGVVKMVWHPKHSHLLFVAGLDGVTRLLDVRSGSLIRQYTGHTANILDASVSS